MKVKYLARPFLDKEQVFETEEQAEEYLDFVCEQQVERCREDGHSYDDLAFVEQDFWRRSSVIEIKEQ